jgi:hypothetical protein
MEIDNRNAIPVPQCSPCDYVGEREVSTDNPFLEFHHIWTEPYELHDPNGNVIRGTAKYMATGQAQVEVKVFEKTCDEPFGDDPRDFASYDPETPNVAFVSYNLKDAWQALPKALRAEMKFLPKKG